MNVKSFLYSVRDEQKEIAELENRIAEAEASLLPAAIRYDRDKVQTSPSDQMTETMVKVAEYVDEMEKHKAKLADRRLKAQKMINMLENSRERQVLDLYFLSSNRLSMCQVGNLMNFSERWIYQIYEQALDHLEKVCSEVQ